MYEGFCDIYFVLVKVLILYVFYDEFLFWAVQKTQYALWLLQFGSGLRWKEF